MSCYPCDNGHYPIIVEKPDRQDTESSAIVSLDAAIDFNEVLKSELEELRMRLSKHHALLLAEVEEDCNRRLHEIKVKKPDSQMEIQTKLGPRWKSVSAPKSVAVESDICWQEEEDHKPSNNNGSMSTTSAKMVTEEFEMPAQPDSTEDVRAIFSKNQGARLRALTCELDSPPPAMSTTHSASKIKIETEAEEEALFEIPSQRKLESARQKTININTNRGAKGRKTYGRKSHNHFSFTTRASWLSMHDEEEDDYLRNKAEHMAVMPDSEAFRHSNSDSSAMIGNLRHSAAAFLRHPAVELAIGILICLNAVIVGIEVDWTVRHPQQASLPVGFSIFSYTLNVLFAIEVSLRMFTLSSKFFIGSHWGWNLFDLSLVLASVVEVAIELLYRSGKESFSNLHVVRMIRVARILRVLRVARVVRLLVALRLLFVQILGTLRSVAWAMVLLMVILYTFGMVFAQVASEHLAATRETGADNIEVTKYWSTVPRAMFTLYKAVTGGVDWEHVAIALSDIHWFWVLLFVCFLSFTIFAVLNVVVGVFCQSAIQTASTDHENAVRLKLQEKRTFIMKIRRLFLDIDESQDGTLTYHELQAHLGDEKVSAYFETLGIESQDAWDLFKLLDKDASQAIDVDEFVEGCMRLRGPAKAMDAAKIMFENRIIKRHLASLKRQTEICLSTIRSSSQSTPCSPGGYELASSPTAGTDKSSPVSEPLNSSHSVIFADTGSGTMSQTADVAAKMFRIKEA